MATEQETNLLIRALTNLHTATRPARWRMLYRTMHNMEQPQKFTQIPALIHFLNSPTITNGYHHLQPILNKYYATYQFGKLSFLQYQYGRGIRRMTNCIMRAIISSILENDDDLIVLNYHIVTQQQRFEFISRTLMSAHKKISEKIPDVAPALTSVKYDTKYNERKRANNKTPANAYYRSTNQYIGLCPESLDKDNIDEVIGLMVHEYVHVLQSVYKSSLPQVIQIYAKENHPALFKLSHDLRTTEQESIQAASIATKRFPERYEKMAAQYFGSEYEI